MYRCDNLKGCGNINRLRDQLTDYYVNKYQHVMNRDILIIKCATFIDGYEYALKMLGLADAKEVTNNAENEND